MFLNKYSSSAKLFACISIAVVFGLLAFRLIPIAPFLDHSVKGSGVVVGYSDSCVQIQYNDSEGHSQSTCTTEIESSDVGAQIDIWYVDSMPGTIIFEDPMLILLGCTVAAFGWFFMVMATLWWNTTRLENWASGQGLTLTRISFVPPWNNPLGQRFRFDVLLRTYKILGMDKNGREYEAWVRFRPFYLPLAKPRVVWADDNVPGSKAPGSKAPEKGAKHEEAPESTLPQGGLTDTIAKRKGERTPTRDAQNELLF